METVGDLDRSTSSVGNKSLISREGSNLEKYSRLLGSGS